jgi:uncharacterized protein
MKTSSLCSVLITLGLLSGTTLSDNPVTLKVGTLNVENYSRRHSGGSALEEKQRRDALTDIFLYDMEMPDIIALQEIMDDSGLRDDGEVRARRNFRSLARSLGRKTGLPWGYVTLPPEDGRDGGRPGANIRPGYLYNRSRVSLSGTPVRWEDGAFAGCRKPLGAVFALRGREIAMVNVHLSSRLGDEKEQILKRVEQARFLAKKTTEIRKDTPLILLLGDFNDTPGSPALSELTRTAGVVETAGGITYVYRNRGEQLDHILATPPLAGALVSAGTIPLLKAGILREYCGDHNPVTAEFYLPSFRVFSTTSDTPVEQPLSRMNSRFPLIRVLSSPSSCP